MKNLTDNLKSSLNESSTSNGAITNYIESWLKAPMNSKDMFAVIGAIVNGAKKAYEYRNDPKYFDESEKKYNDATKVLADFIDQLK